LAGVRVAYADARYAVFGAHSSWLTVFLEGSLLGALVAARVLKIAF
jgi:hypothetical protein